MNRTEINTPKKGNLYRCIRGLQEFKEFSRYLCDKDDVLGSMYFGSVYDNSFEEYFRLVHNKPKKGYIYRCRHKPYHSFKYEIDEQVKCYNDNYLGTDNYNDYKDFILCFDVVGSFNLVKKASYKSSEIKLEDKIVEKYNKNMDNTLEQTNGKGHKGLRYNKNKLRYDLVHPWSHEQMVKAITKGSEKYEERNWEKGMSWSTVIASLERHLQSIKKGEDYDKESGLLHASHLAANVHFLTAYYKIYPEGDDRPIHDLSSKKIGLDIDDVLADFIGKWTEVYGNVNINSWNFDKDMKEKFDSISKDKDFWMTIKSKVNPNDIPFEPSCYITSRPIPTEWTEEWLQLNGFPIAPVLTCKVGESKVDLAKASNIDYFIDDKYENFVELNKSGICTFLMDAPHNQRYDVGHKRIFNIKDILKNE